MAKFLLFMVHYVSIFQKVVFFVLKHKKKMYFCKFKIKKKINKLNYFI